MATTIQLSQETRAKLSRLKASPRETYEEVLNKLLALIPEGDEDGPSRLRSGAGCSTPAWS